MKNLLTKKNIIIALIIYYISAGVFYYAAYNRIYYTEYRNGVSELTGYVEELVDGSEIIQDIFVDCDYIYSMRVRVATFGRKNQGTIELLFEDENGNILKNEKYKASKIEDNSDLIFHINKSIPSGTYRIKIKAEGAGLGQAITVYYNDKDTTFGEQFTINGEVKNGSILLTVEGGIYRTYGIMFWPIVLVIGVILYLHFNRCIKLNSEKKKNVTIRMIDILAKYKFLIKQLVERDFKSKYKRSTLGVCWSLLYPVLLMAVQYVIFSTIFRANIENYPVYLLSASVLFTFFSDSVGAGLMAIVGNASLITKVYVPKYIYPVSKVLSTGINLVLSMVPLLIVVLITGGKITRAYLLIPFVFLCILIFCIGMSFLLSASMVFFRDTQFLWSVVTMLWMYATPMFYPESVIPERWSIILTANPMYHYISFLRTILMRGISPNIMEYLYCMGLSLLVLGAGVFVYKKTQDKFVLYI